MSAKEMAMKRLDRFVLTVILILVLAGFVAGQGGSQVVSQGPLTSGAGYLYNGASWDPQRSSNVFKTATATASGNTAVWTPAASKKFRLLGYCVDVTSNAAQTTAGVITVDLQDATTSTNNTWSVFVPGAAGTTLTASDQACNYSMGNGVLSAAANNALNVNLSAALTAGVVRVRAWGVEE